MELSVWNSAFCLCQHMVFGVLELHFTHNIQSQACRVNQVSCGKFSNKMSMAQEGRWPAPSRAPCLPVLPKM